MTFSSDGRYLAGADWINSIRVWDVVHGREAASLSANHVIAFGVAFSPDGRTLAAGCEDGTVRLWNTATWRPTITLRTGSSGFRMWSAKTWSPSAARRSGAGGVNSLVFSPDGRTIAASCFDSSVRFWHAPGFAVTDAAGAQ
jgi:WD40 repeat protein